MDGLLDLDRMRILVALTFASALAFAQTSTGRIVGSVVDPTGAVIPGVTVTLHNENTGEERTTTANDQGYYIAPQLPPGVYSLTGKGSGLGPQEYREVHLAVGQERTLNMILQPASLTTEV